jgi:hypothetical protein
MSKTSTGPNRSLFIAAGAVSILAGTLPVIGFQLLGNYGYPELIRETPQVILGTIHETGNALPYLYYIGVGGAGIGIFFLALLLEKIFHLAGDDTWGYLGKYCAMVNGLCLYGGIIRWTFLFPLLARFRVEGIYDTRSVDLVFEAFSTYVGDSIAEHVGFTFMFFWVLFFSIAILKTRVLNKWLGLAGIFLSIVIFYGNLEFFGAPGAFWANRNGAEWVPLWAIALGVNLIWIRNIHLVRAKSVIENSESN